MRMAGADEMGGVEMSRTSWNGLCARVRPLFCAICATETDLPSKHYSINL